MRLGGRVIVRDLLVNGPERYVAGKSVGAISSAGGFSGGNGFTTLGDLRCDIAASAAEAKSVGKVKCAISSGAIDVE